jgi:malonyl CoA-acyl carrier protein transacylase
VISGLKGDIARAEVAFHDVGIRHFIPLTVSGAFHSRYMQSARKEFEIFLDGFKFHDLKMSVLSNVNAGAYEQGAIKKMLAEQMTSPVQWSEIVTALLKMPEPEFFEMGPGTILTGLLKQIRRLSF